NATILEGAASLMRSMQQMTQWIADAIPFGAMKTNYQERADSLGSIATGLEDAAMDRRMQAVKDAAYVLTGILQSFGVAAEQAQEFSHSSGRFQQDEVDRMVEHQENLTELTRQTNDALENEHEDYGRSVTQTVKSYY